MTVLIALFLLCADCRAQQAVSLSLSGCEEAAFSSSHQLKSARAELAAAISAENALLSPLYPRIAMEGWLKYSGVIPAMTLPIVGKQYLGDNWNYSIGPAAYWTVYDAGARALAHESADKLALAKEEEVKNISRQVALAARMAYFRAQYSLERLYLVAGQHKLAAEQYRDISLNAAAGVKTRLDELMSHQQLLERGRQLRQARSDLSAALRALCAVSGDECGYDPSLPLDWRLNYRDYGIEPPTALVSAEPAAGLLEKMRRYAAAKPDFNSPGLRALELSASSYRAAAQSRLADTGPKITLSARSALEYPNGPSLYSFGQNSAGAAVSFPLFESGKNGFLSQQQESMALSADERRLQLVREIRRDFGEAADAFASLEAQQRLNIQAAKEAEEAARLTYDSYNAGRSTYLELEAANLRELEAKTQTALTDAQMLMELALLASLE
ncbi:MAG: TolC family protein [Elusimicrobiales bacterium]